MLSGHQDRARFRKENNQCLYACTADIHPPTATYARQNPMPIKRKKRVTAVVRAGRCFALLVERGGRYLSYFVLMLL